MYVNRLAEIEKDAKRAHAMSSQGMGDGLSGPNGSVSILFVDINA